MGPNALTPALGLRPRTFPSRTVRDVSNLVVVTGGAGSGKTAALVEAAARRYDLDPFASTLVLVPTMRHADQFRRRLVERCGVAFGLEVSTIGLYARRFVPADRVATPEVATELLRRVSNQEIKHGVAGYFAPIADTPGLKSLIGESIAELVQDEVGPAEFGRAAKATGDPALAALAAIYTSYTAALNARDLRDPRTIPSAAAQAIRDDVTGLAAAIFDGFQFLRTNELALLASLAQTTDVAIGFDPDAGERARHTAGELDRLFPDAEQVETTHPPTTPEVSASTLPDAEAQLRSIVRDVKQRLNGDDSLRPSDFCITFRLATPNLALARHVFAEYDLPFDPAAAERLSNTPIGAWLLRLLRIPAHGWRLVDVIDVLSSAFIDRDRWQLDRGAIELVMRHGRRNHLWTGLETLRRIPTGLVADSELDGRDARYAERLRAAANAFERALDELGPLLDQVHEEPLGRFAARLDVALFGATPLVRLERDRPASVDVAISALRRELGAFVAIDEALGGEPADLPSFISQLEHRLERPGVVLREAGGVLFAPMHTLHGLRFAHVSVGGLIEGEFPAPRRARALLDIRTRSLLHEAGLAMPPPARTAEDELWHTVSSRADQSISLWRPRLDDRGRPHARSYYFDALGVVSQDQSGHVEPAGAASNRELAAALTERWSAGERRRPPEMPSWATIRSAIPIEQLRRSFVGAGRYEGQVPSASLERLTGSEATWSPSRFESYLMCSFHFFSQYGLRLRELDEELDSGDAATRGTVAHEMLEAALSPLAAEGRALNTDSVEEAVHRLRISGPPIWKRAPEQYGFGRAALWRIDGESMLVALEALLRREADRSSTLGISSIVGTEVDVTGEIETDGPPLRVSGKVDRLDRAGTLLQVVDYKTGREIERRDVVTSRRVQLQLYTYLARKQLGGGRTVARYSYLDPLNEKWDLDTAEDADATLIDQAVAAAVGVRDAVESGSFHVSPSVPACPSYCSFLNICRVNEFSRSKQWS